MSANGCEYRLTKVHKKNGVFSDPGDLANLSDAQLQARLRSAYRRAGGLEPVLPLAGVSRLVQPLKRRNLHDLSALLEGLPAGQRRVALALSGSGYARTYQEVAAELDLSIGTVYRHLERIRRLRPTVYAALMEIRRDELVQRHREALQRDQLHSQAWHRRRANRRYYERFGSWPWERYS